MYRSSICNTWMVSCKSLHDVSSRDLSHGHWGCWRRNPPQRPACWQMLMHGWAMWWMLMDLVVTQAQALLPCRICQSQWGSHWGLHHRQLKGSGQEQQELMFRYLGHNGFLSACSIRSVWKSNLFPAFRLPGGVTMRVDSSRPCGKTWSVSRRPVGGVNKAWPRMSKNLQYFPRTNHRGELLPNHHLVET